MSETGQKKRVLETIECLSGIVFGFIEVPTFTGSVATADHVEVKDIRCGKEAREVCTSYRQASQPCEQHGGK